MPNWLGRGYTPPSGTPESLALAAELAHEAYPEIPPENFRWGNDEEYGVGSGNPSSLAVDFVRTDSSWLLAVFVLKGHKNGEDVLQASLGQSHGTTKEELRAFYKRGKAFDLIPGDRDGLIGWLSLIWDKIDSRGAYRAALPVYKVRKKGFQLYCMERHATVHLPVGALLLYDTTSEAPGYAAVQFLDATDPVSRKTVPTMGKEEACLFLHEGWADLVRSGCLEMTPF